MDHFINGFLVGAGVFSGIVVAGIVIMVIFSLIFNKKEAKK